MCQTFLVFMFSSNSSVLNNRPVTFFTKFALLIRTRFSTYPLPISLIGPVTLLSTAWIFFLPEGLLRFSLCLRKPGLLIGPVTRALVIHGWCVEAQLFTPYMCWADGKRFRDSLIFFSVRELPHVTKFAAN